MNTRILERSDGKRRPLYPEMLDLLLRLNTRAATGDGFEIARRTRELLEQFERNQDQQIFLLTIFEKLDERTLQEVDLFDGIKLTLLTEVTQNGVHTLESVAGNALSDRPPLIGLAIGAHHFPIGYCLIFSYVIAICKMRG